MHCIIVVMIVKQMIRGKDLKHASCDVSEIIHKVVTQLFLVNLNWGLELL